MFSKLPATRVQESLHEEASAKQHQQQPCEGKELPLPGSTAPPSSPSGTRHPGLCPWCRWAEPRGIGWDWKERPPGFGSKKTRDHQHLQVSDKATHPPNCFDIFFQKWEMDGKALCLRLQVILSREPFKVVKDIFHMSKDWHHPSCKWDWSVSCFMSFNAEEEEQNEDQQLEQEHSSDYTWAAQEVEWRCELRTVNQKVPERITNSCTNSNAHVVGRRPSGLMTARPLKA